MGLPALRPDGAPRPVLRPEPPEPPPALPPLPGGDGLPGGEVGPGPLPGVHPVRLRHGGHQVGGRGRRGLHGLLPGHGSAGHPRRRLPGAGQQPQGPQRRPRGRRGGRQRPGPGGRGAARHGQGTRQVRRRGGLPAAGRGPQGRLGDFTKGAGLEPAQIDAIVQVLVSGQRAAARPTGARSSRPWAAPWRARRRARRASPSSKRCTPCSTRRASPPTGWASSPASSGAWSTTRARSSSAS